MYINTHASSAIFKYMGQPVSLYATKVKPEWANDVQGALNEVGADGWQFIKDYSGFAVFYHKGTPITYSAINGSYPLPSGNLEEFINQMGSIGLKYLGFSLNHYGFQH